MVHVHLNKSIEGAMVVFTTQPHFGFRSDVRLDCNKTGEILRFWELSKVHTDSGFFSTLFTYSKLESQRVQLETEKFGEGYIYVRCVSKMLGTAGTISYDYGFVHITRPPLVAEITGPSVIPALDKYAILNASNSYDPADKQLRSEGLDFYWYCRQEGDTDLLPIDASKPQRHKDRGCFGRISDAGAVLAVPVREMKSEESYIFQVTIKKDRRVANFTHNLHIEGSLSFQFR